MTTQCRDQLTRQLRESIQRKVEGIVYFVGLTTGDTSLALSSMAPEAEATARSVDVSAAELGKVIRFAALAELQVVGQLHTHPCGSRHSDGDLAGMRIRHPGYFSIVVPNYGAELPSFGDSHTLMWTSEGFQEVKKPVTFFHETWGMNQQEYRRRFLDREKRYPDWEPLPADRPVHIHVDPGYAATYAGQVAAITAASLFGRMSTSVSMEVASMPILAPLPWDGEKLDEVVMRTLQAADPYGCYEQRSPQNDDLCLVLGRNGNGHVVHGSGWRSYCGEEPSPIPQSDEPNPFGAAFAVVAAASRLPWAIQAATIEPILMDTYHLARGSGLFWCADGIPSFRSWRTVVHWSGLRRQLCPLFPRSGHEGLSSRPGRPRLRKGRECHALCIVYVAGCN